MVLTKPAEAFTAMKREGGFGEPLMYAIIGGSVGGIVSFSFHLFAVLGHFRQPPKCRVAHDGMGIRLGRIHYSCFRSPS